MRKYQVGIVQLSSGEDKEENLNRICVLRFRTSGRSFSLNIWLTSGLMRLLRRRSLSKGFAAFCSKVDCALAVPPAASKSK